MRYRFRKLLNGTLTLQFRREIDRLKAMKDKPTGAIVRLGVQVSASYRAGGGSLEAAGKRERL